MNKPFIYVVFALTLFFNISIAQKSEISKVNQDFSEDPGWEGYNNRIDCEDCPEINQNFGWTNTNHNKTGQGEISGTIWKSTTPAYYAMPIGPFTFKDKFSASGKLSVIAPLKEGWGFYIGFFNAERQGWRVWSSCGFRMGPEKEGHMRFHLDYKTGQGAGAILNPDIIIPTDGSVHDWEILYEPEVGVGETWPHPKLRDWFKGIWGNVHEDSILAQAQQDEPAMTKNHIHDLLLQARDAGLIDHWYRKGSYHLWSVERDIDKIKGRITFKFDNYDPVSYFLIPGHTEHTAQIDRFGVFNMQMYHGSMKFFLSDLTVNDEKIDLSSNPQWDERGNRVTFIERDFHARQNFGYAQTNWAGKSPGEIGGRFYGTEVKDPSHGYYADNIGELTLDDPISFSGNICFPEGAVDGRMLFGYFNKKDKQAEIEGEYKGNPPHQFLGLEVMDQTRYGYNITAVCSPRQDIAIEERGPIYIPDRIKRPFSFTYNPKQGEAGRITVTFGDSLFTADLTKEQREIGATMDHFGLLNPRKGGKYVDVYLDDLSYDVKHSKDFKAVKHQQKIIKVPYPPEGRLYK